ncbi:ParM/StbA family protein [Coleofasciculus sp. LEGE 07081]|nr:ParM/StbA family protein [Coleofasciculus sp. LEGE 07081]
MGKSTRPPNLTMTIDFGGSLTKAIFADAFLNEYLLVMEPEVISVPAAAIAAYEETKLGSPDLADAAWISIEDHSYVVGYLAQSKFHGNPGLSSLKYERAFPKALAAVWVASRVLKLKRKFTVALAILMPSAEYESGKQLYQMLWDGLKNFDTPTGKINANLTHFDCKPEGGGIYMMSRQKMGDEAKRKTIAVVMVGYRNASVLLSERGQVTQRKTSNLGFIKMVEQVEGRITGLPSTSQLARAIALAGVHVESRYLEPLSMSSTPQTRTEEVDRLVMVVKSCRDEYALALRSWLREVLPRQTDLDLVVLCGGTAEYMKPELEQVFDYTEVSWNADIQLPDHLQTEDLGNRLCDAYGTHLYFKGVIANALRLDSPSVVAASG